MCFLTIKRERKRGVETICKLIKLLYLGLVIDFKCFNAFLIAIKSSDTHALFDNWYYYVFLVPAEKHNNTVLHHSLYSFFPLLDALACLSCLFICQIYINWTFGSIHDLFDIFKTFK